MGTTSVVIVVFFFLDLPVLSEALAGLPVVFVVLTEKILSHPGQFFLAIAASGEARLTPLAAIARKNWPG